MITTEKGPHENFYLMLVLFLLIIIKGAPGFLI